MFASHVTATFSNPASAGAYAAGDMISNSATAGSVVPLTFQLPLPSGRITGARCVVTPASGNLVIAALDFDLLLFRPESSIPYAAGAFPADNAAFVTSAAAFRECVGYFRFAEGAWRNPAGALTAGVTGWQSVSTAVTAVVDRGALHFNVSGLANSLIGCVQVLDIWTPGAVINRFDFVLDVECND
jgi:hypothetical protein